MKTVTEEEWQALLRLVLAQRLEINAIESALTNANVLTASQIREIRLQATQTAQTWGLDHDLLALAGMHALPDATMQVPLSDATRDELRREIDDQTPQR